MKEKSWYVRALELISVVSEEWGEAVKEINNYSWKGNKLEQLEKALEEINQIRSPLEELEKLLLNERRWIINLPDLKQEATSWQLATKKSC